MNAEILNAAIMLGAGLLCARLCLSGLHRRYQAFFVFLIFFALQNLAVAVAGYTSSAYYRFYVVTEPVAWFLYAWVVLELYSLVLKDYQGLYTVGRWSLMAAIALAMLGSAASLLVPSHATAQGHLLSFYYVAERAVYFSLVVFLLSMVAVLTRYPITLNRNIIIHSVVFSIYFFGTTVAFFLLSTRGMAALRMATYMIQALNFAALGAWLALLNPRGERCPQRLRMAWRPQQEEKLAHQLNTLNLALRRVARV